ncbi:MAG TPA: response regulator [Cycloclasticus sp.]|jgi:two-component system invasion response regulator UvrY|nr:response regulator [Cycloclasticus sp.]HIL92870.1 response regulator [Cycloclasticus sp.]
MNSNNINILLVDDHELVRSGIEYLLDADPDITVMAVASSGEEAIDLSERLQPDVILMDLNMPGIGGSEAIKRIVRKQPPAKIIALSVYDDGPVPQQSITLGAKGYINKGCPVDEMIKAIVMVYQGKSYLSSAVASNLLFSAQKPDENVFTRLSSRELQIISKIVDGHAISDIADALAISPKTVNTHRYRAHEKLGVSNDVELVRLAVDTGQLKNI